MEYIIAAVVIIAVIALVLFIRKPAADDDFVQIVVEDKPLVIPAEALHQIPVHRVIKAKLKPKKPATPKKPVR